MNYRVLFVLILFILTFVQTVSLTHHCNHDVQSSSSGMADIQELTTLKYCLIDNCTIMRIDTEEQLDIVYTTQAHILVTPTDGQTSTIFATKNSPELFCSTLNTINGFTIDQIVGLLIVAFLGLVSGYIAMVHILFKEIRGTFGKLLMFANIATVIQCVDGIALSITRQNISVNWMSCYIFTFLFIQLGVVHEAFATSAISYLTYVMHSSYRGREVTKAINQKLYKYGLRYALGSSFIFGFFVVTYDFTTGTHKMTLTQNGSCNIFFQTEYDTIRLFRAYLYLNEIVQILILTTYFVYYYKVNKLLKTIRDMASINNNQQQIMFFKIAVTMGATQGISQIIFASSWYLIA